MIAAWMLYSAAVGILIGAAALAGDRFCRMIRVPMRWVWIGAMATTVLLSFGGLLRLSAGGTPTPDGSGVEALAVETAPGAALPADVVSTTLREVSGAAAAAATAAYAFVARYAGDDRGLSVAWVAFTSALLMLLGVTLLRLRRARRGWRHDRVGDLPVLVSRDTGPALVGLVRPSIVVPVWLLGEPAERQRLVVQHEDEHRCAGDHVVLAVACAIVCLLPWNVALWWMLRRTRLTVELDCDARVLRRGAGARSYGSLLLDIAARTRGLPFGVPALVDSPTHLERRLLAMTEKNRTPHRVRASLAAFSALLLLAAACTTELPTAAAIDEMDVTAAEAEAAQAGLVIRRVDGQGPIYFVDGVRVSEEEARGLSPRQIRSIEVLKAAAAAQAYGAEAGNGAVNILTVSAEEVAGVAEPVRAPLGTAEGSAGTEIVMSHDGQSRAATIRANRVQLHAQQADGRNPLIILDGELVAESFSLSSISPDNIERIEVVKGEAARVLYEDARAVNGVIRITTKNGGR